MRFNNENATKEIEVGILDIAFGFGYVIVVKQPWTLEQQRYGDRWKKF